MYDERLLTALPAAGTHLSLGAFTFTMMMALVLVTLPSLSALIAACAIVILLENIA